MAFELYAPRWRDACLALFDANCPDYFAPNERDYYERYLEAHVGDYLVARDGDEIVGAFGVVEAGASERRTLNWIMIAPARQGAGVGRAMMAHAIAQARAEGAAWLDIAASHKSEPFFARFGAVAVKRTENGWGPGMHRVDMELGL